MRRIQAISQNLGFRKGMTLAEVAIVIVVLGIIFPVFMMLIVNSYRDTFALDDKQRTSSQIMQALWYIEDTITNASTFLTTVPAPYVDPYGKNNAGTAGVEAWSYKGTSATDRVLISLNYATTTNALNTGRQPVFKNTIAFNCTTEMSYQPQLTYATVFFVKDSTLYKRIITDRTSALCPGNVQYQKLTCPPYITGTGRNAACQANDEVLVNNVSNFAVDYFQLTAAGSGTPVDPGHTSTDPDVLNEADYVIVTIGAIPRAGVPASELTQRMTKVNQREQ